jgi:predicted XRE-type DNA-binding protein
MINFEIALRNMVICDLRKTLVVRGKISKFSLDMLLGFLDRMGEEVRIEVGKPRKRKLEHADKA